ncbi:hypothetical protein QTQ03_07325 [Micromonospora sp. WMMA1363]|uniref:hypothetical protein n=1 Tax=Micromonospora sp. WMMA1363 TaxID=3053985 RepID=UPI00259C8E88|nr:hypothetical protein [Micromonospora sp. WMMA1363]MDM4719418.1 hypothetical protein [Micromonospora sp. WMMA1363]
MTRPGTPADRRAQLTAGLTALACEGCGAQVLVGKSSPPQTSVQWTIQAALDCAARTPPEHRPTLTHTCVALRDTIERAVRDGRLRISAPA